LVDTESNTALYHSNAAYGGAFIISDSGIDIGIDERGFFVRERRQADGTDGERFRSTKFEQILLTEEPDQSNLKSRVKYVDTVWGWEFECDVSVMFIKPYINGVLESAYPGKMHVEQRKRDPAEYRYIVAALRRICVASIEMGNPIVWC
jgi:hypothetical protein